MWIWKNENWTFNINSYSEFISISLTQTTSMAAASLLAISTYTPHTAASLHFMNDEWAKGRVNGPSISLQMYVYII